MIARSKYAHGKLLITGEYLVMEGARALALPLNVGQYLSWKKTREKDLVWNAMKPDGIWFQAKYSLPALKLRHTSDETLSARLVHILKQTRRLNPGFLDGGTGFEVQTILEFDPDLGFGSSSTLVSNLAGWAEVDPYALSALTFGGSGYDIACARMRTPIFYTLADGKPRVEHAHFNPPFKDNLLFVYLGAKQNSGESIARFRKKATFSEEDMQRISRIGSEMETTESLSHFENLLEEHEEIMSAILKMPKIKDLHFPGHHGAVKSLGAWGGDFCLMTFHDDLQKVSASLENAGFGVHFTYKDLTE